MGEGVHAKGGGGQAYKWCSAKGNWIHKEMKAEHHFVKLAWIPPPPFFVRGSLPPILGKKEYCTKGWSSNI